MINQARRLLINFGKMIPFVLCFIVLISYTESLYALCTDNVMLYGDSAALYTPISFYIAKRFEYDWLTILATTILSISIETCYWNKLALFYLFVQLWEKTCFSTIELYSEYIYAIIAVNLLCSGFFVFKGITILFRKNN